MEQAAMVATDWEPAFAYGAGILLLLWLLPLSTFFAPRDHTGARWFANALLFASLGMLLFVALGVGVGFGFSAYPLFNLLFLLLVLGNSIPTAIRYRSRLCGAMGVVAAGCILVLHAVDFTPVKPFTRFYAAIETGMPEPQVLELLDKHFPEDGRFKTPVFRRSEQNDRLGSVLDPQDGRYNAEMITIGLRDGRVVRKEYFPD